MTMPERRDQAVDWVRARERLARAELSLADHASDPERITSAYRERAAILARPASAEAPERQFRRVLVFRLGNDCYAAPLSQLERIIPDPACTPLPGVEERWAGVMIAGGEIVPVLHLARVLGLSEADLAAERHALILRATRPVFGLLVGRVLEIRGLPRTDLRPSNGNLRLIEGVAPGSLLVLDIDALVAQELLQ
jgi:chemotaxis signal transduction protein